VYSPPSTFPLCLCGVGLFLYWALHLFRSESAFRSYHCPVPHPKHWFPVSELCVYSPVVQVHSWWRSMSCFTNLWSLPAPPAPFRLRTFDTSFSAFRTLVPFFPRPSLSTGGPGDFFVFFGKVFCSGARHQRFAFLADFGLSRFSGAPPTAWVSEAFAPPPCAVLLFFSFRLLTDGPFSPPGPVFFFFFFPDTGGFKVWHSFSCRHPLFFRVTLMEARSNRIDPLHLVAEDFSLFFSSGKNWVG